MSSSSFSDDFSEGLARLIDERIVKALAAATRAPRYVRSEPVEDLTERVARAMWEDLHRRAGWSHRTWEDAGDRVTKPHYREQAKSAIKAMREFPGDTA